MNVTAESIAAARGLVRIASLRRLADHEAAQLRGVIDALALDAEWPTSRLAFRPMHGREQR